VEKHGRGLLLVSAVAISKFESGRVKQIPSTNAALQRALADRGIVFFADEHEEGVKILKKKS
jgi:hypothetical protein